MSKKTSEPAKKPDQHKGRMIRQDDDVMDLMQQLADAGSRPLTREVRLALIAYLTAKGKWPPASST